MTSWRGRVAWVGALAAPAVAVAFGACSSFSEDTSAASEAGADGPPTSSVEASAEGATGDATKASAYRALVMSDAPLAYWRMGAAIDGVIADETGRANHLVLQGGAQSFTLGVPGAIADDDDPAVHFDGIAGFARALDGKPFNFPAGSSFTVEAWVRTVDIPQAFPFQHVISQTEDLGGERHGFSLFVTPKITDAGATASATFEFNPNEGGAQTSVGKAVTPAKWTHLVGVATNATVTVYVDTTVGTARALKGMLGIANATFFLAASRDPANQFSGDVDEVAIYAKALPLDRIAAHSSAGRR
jgi:hypothetical protein